jgi:putative (di)nucleoside polyphosphate hydrolase
VIDAEGFRANVGIILADRQDRLFWACRVGRAGWQFPQGGIDADESPEQALFRELAEEIGLGPQHIELLGRTQGWLRYRLPARYQRPGSQPLCIGQKQVWFLLRFTGAETDLRFDTTGTPEFEAWRWVDYWTPLDEVVFFKRRVYEQALIELAPLLFGAHAPPRPARVTR